jgi:hypothetical protein
MDFVGAVKTSASSPLALKDPQIPRERGTHAIPNYPLSTSSLSDMQTQAATASTNAQLSTRYPLVGKKFMVVQTLLNIGLYLVLISTFGCGN